MRRVSVLLALLVVILGGSVLSSRLSPASVAQEATPAAGAVVLEMLGHGLPNAASGYDLSLYRVSLGPGAVVPPHTHPGAAVVYVETGTFAFTPLEGEAWLMPAGTSATPEAQGEALTLGTEITVNAGDALFFPDEHGDTGYNAGDDTLVLWLANLHTAGEPMLTMMDMATPMP